MSHSAFGYDEVWMLETIRLFRRPVSRSCIMSARQWKIVRILVGRLKLAAYDGNAVRDMEGEYLNCMSLTSQLTYSTTMYCVMKVLGRALAGSERDVAKL